MSDRVIFKSIWLLVGAAILSLFPFTIFSTFLVPIADAAGHTSAEIGTLRGLGGIAALIIGIGFAPIINRFIKQRVAVFSLLLLGSASFLGAIGTYPALIFFCFAIGAATALLTPSLLAIATDHFKQEAASARAATIITSTQSLAAVMAGPVIGGMALLGGWQGALIITGVISVVAALFFGKYQHVPHAPKSSVKYLDAFRQLRARPVVIGLIAIAMLRTAAFMGYLAYAAAVYFDHFQVDAYTFTFVWTVSGVAFFISNFFAGKYLNTSKGHFAHIYTVLIMSLIVATGAALLIFTTPVFALALVGTALMGVSHAVIAACVTTLIVRKSGEVKNPALAINSAGMSLGVFVGAAVGGLGLSIASYTGAAIALSATTVLGLAIALWVVAKTR